ncbi:MAG: DUF5715 family protein [Bacteroidales bacterium]
MNIKSVDENSMTVKPKKQLRKGRVALALIILLLVPGVFIIQAISAKVHNRMNPKPVGTVRVKKYKDLNDSQLVYAKKLGIKPLKTNNAFFETKNELLSDGKIEKIDNGRGYVVSKLDYSHPYLVPEAAKLLDDIGKRFREKLKEQNKGNFYFKVSSLLRTEENQKALSRSNTNASRNSTHLFATTFDIPYTKVIKKPFPWVRREVADASVIKLLSDAIGELRDEGRCLVVTEYNEKCFHITVMK